MSNMLIPKYALKVGVNVHGENVELAIAPNNEPTHVRYDRIVISAYTGRIGCLVGKPLGRIADPCKGDITLGFVAVKPFSTVIGHSDIYEQGEME